MKKEKVLLIGGPTGVGKTKLSLLCAKKFDGEVISADCIQVYRNLNIGSAKIKESEKQGIPHHLIDVLEASDAFDTDTFREFSKTLIMDLTKRKKLPIIVGGTGFYMRTLLFPYTLGSSAKNEAVRKKYETLIQEKGNEFVYELLKQVDPESAKVLFPNDVKRVIRALEIYETTGKKKSEQTVTLESPYDYTLVVLTKNRKDLYDTINQRVDKMFEEGLLEEVTALIQEKKLPRTLQSMSGIGYREFFDYFDGKLTLEQVKEKIKQDSRNYAKRQLTYFKTMPNVHFFEVENGLEEVLSFIQKELQK